MSTAAQAQIAAFLDQAVPASADRDVVERLLQPSVVLSPGAPRKGVGLSQLGGAPDLPEGESWPVGESGPLSFVMQIDLSEVASAWASWEVDEPPLLLPTGGMLYAFLDRDDARVGRLLFREKHGLVEAGFPAELGRAKRVKKASLTPCRTFSLPGYEDTVYRSSAPVSGKLQDTIQELNRKIPWHVGASTGGYRMLGYAGSWQEDVKTVLARRALEHRGVEGDARELSREMELLLEIQLDDGTDYTNLHRWGRGGTYFGLPRAELERGALEDASMVFQPNG